MNFKTVQEMIYSSNDLYCHLLDGGKIAVYNKTTQEISLYENSKITSLIIKINKKGLDFLSRAATKTFKDIYNKHT